MNRPASFHVGGTVYWVLRLYDPTDGITLIDADSTPTVAVRKNGSAVGDSVTVTKRSATTGIYDCSYNPASEIEGDKFTLEESAVIGGDTFQQNWEVVVKAVERGTDSAYTGTPPTAAEIRDAFLDRVLAGNHEVAGTPGKLMQAITETRLAQLDSGNIPAELVSLLALAADIYTDTGNTLADTATMLARLTVSRAGYLDNLNVGGAVASQADILAINQSASRRLLLATVGQYERPESGSTTYTVEARTYDGDGAATNADSTPTLTGTGQTSGSLAANIGAATNPATGLYRWSYTQSSAATLEPIRFDLSATIGGSTFTLSTYTQSVDFVAATFSTTDQANLTAIFNKLPSKPYLAGTANSDGDVQMNEATGNYGGTVGGISGTIQNLDQLNDAQNDMHSATGDLVSAVGANVISILGRFTGMTSLADWLRRMIRKDAGTAGMTTALAEINTTGGGATANDSLENIIDTGSTGPWTSGGGGGGGTGANSVNPTVTDGVDPLEGAKIRYSLGAFSHLQQTQDDGQPPTPFGLDNGTWDVVVTMPGYESIVTTLEVNGTETPTYPMTLTAISPPANPAAITAVYSLLDSGYSPASGVAVHYRVITPVTAGFGVEQDWESVNTNGSGLAQIPVLPGVEYEFVIASTDEEYCRFRATIPGDATNGYVIPPATTWRL